MPQLWKFEEGEIRFKDLLDHENGGRIWRHYTGTATALAGVGAGGINMMVSPTSIDLGSLTSSDFYEINLVDWISKKLFTLPEM